eukprot:5068505-Amphidinium_carterae.1
MEAFYLTEGLSREEFLASSQLTSILRSHIAMGSLFVQTMTNRRLPSQDLFSTGYERTKTRNTKVV